MQVSTQDGKHFTLMRETPADQQFIDALDHEHTIHITDVLRQCDRNKYGGFENTGVVLAVTRDAVQTLQAEAGCQALCPLGELLRLLLSKSAQHGPPSAPPAFPQPQKQLAASLVQLQVVLDAFREVVIQQEIVLKKMQGAHGGPSVVEATIVKE